MIAWIKAKYYSLKERIIEIQLIPKYKEVIQTIKTNNKDLSKDLENLKLADNINQETISQLRGLLAKTPIYEKLYKDDPHSFQTTVDIFRKQDQIVANKIKDQETQIKALVNKVI
jgi:hypothetical protein